MIRIDDLTKVVGARTLFTIDHLSIGACDKVGLIGDNGTRSSLNVGVNSFPSLYLLFLCSN